MPNYSNSTFAYNYTHTRLPNFQEPILSTTCTRKQIFILVNDVGCIKTSNNWTPQKLASSVDSHTCITGSFPHFPGTFDANVKEKTVNCFFFCSGYHSHALLDEFLFPFFETKVGWRSIKCSHDEFDSRQVNRTIVMEKTD